MVQTPPPPPTPPFLPEAFGRWKYILNIVSSI